MIPKSNLPHFFYDAIDNLDENYEAEVMIDFFMSWTLRCAVEKYKDINILLQKYSKNVLLFLLKDKLNGVLDNEIEITEVKTWKQWQKIDLIADVIVKIKGIEKKFVLVFENKLYTGVHDDQLNRYADLIKKTYKGQGFEYLFFLLVGNDEIKQEDINACNNAIEKYTPLTILELRTHFAGKDKNEDVEPTGNYLFDEFWFRHYFYDKGEDFTCDELKEKFVEGTYKCNDK